MFKVRLLLLAVPFATCSLGAKAIKPRVEDGLNYFTMSPLYADGSVSTIVFSMKSASRKTYSFSTYLINDLYPSGVLIQSDSTAKTGIYTYYYNNQYTRPRGNSIKIVVTGSDVNINTSHSFSVANGKSILLGGSTNSIVATAPTCRYSTLNGWVDNLETLEFENFNEYYVSDYYHKLDISSLVIHRGVVRSEIIMSSCSAALAISNVSGAFNEFPHSGSVAQIPVNIVQDGNDFSLTFPEMYVEKHTLKMSPSKLTNYVKTKYLYLPRDEKRFEQNYNCSLVLKNIGADCNRYTLQFTLKSLLNTMGDCRNSEYCIVNT